MEKSKITKNKRKSDGRLKEIFGKAVEQSRKHIRTAMKKLKALIKKTTGGADTKMLKEYSRCALFTVFGFLMSVARLPQGIRPLGISAMCAVSDKNSGLFTYIGAALGCITYREDALSSFIIYFMLYAVRKTFTESKFREKLLVKLASAAVSSIIVGIIRICTASEALIYSYAALISGVCITVAYTYFFGVLFDDKEYSASGVSTLCICSYAFMAALVLSFDNAVFMGIDLQLALCCLITLSYAVINGFLHSGSVGFICGIACASPISGAALGLSGIVSALLLSKSILASAISFAAVFFSVVTYSAGLNTAVYLLPSVICGCAVFFPFCSILPDSLRLTQKSPKSESLSPFSCISSAHTKKLSDAFFSISETFRRLAEKQRYPSFSDVSTIVDKSFARVCEGCALSEMCFAKKKTDTDQLKQLLFAVLSTRSAQKEDFGDNMCDKCIRLEKHVETVNECYRQLSLAKSENNGTALLGAQYSGMARLVNNVQKVSSQELERDEVFEKKLASALKDASIPFSVITVFSEREKNTRIHGISLDRIPFGAKELKKYLYSRLGVKITEPSFDISEKTDYVMSFARACTFRFEYARVCNNAKSEDVCGDSVSFLPDKNNYFRALICDGMGSGRNAAVSSRLASLFIEKMLETGAEKQVLLELLNNALMSVCDESFSTVDLFEADMLTGKSVFVKAGAAPSYVLRKGKLYKIFSATPPVGIITGFTSEITSFRLEKDDVVIMVSDGVVQNNEDSAFIAELIKTDISRDAGAIARDIEEKSKELYDTGDDVSICVIKALEEKK